ncbi:MAG TPA: hypothetical protein VMG12_24375, partial [Polyangiaceae bacterium]|nr:hypothetical protein [Polyangiaceae bacterium]
VGESERDTPAPAVASAQHAAASAPGVAVPVASVPPLAVPAPTAALAPARAPESDAGARAARAARDDAAPHRSRWRWGGRAGLVADMGTLPELGLGPTLGAAWGVDWIEARASGTYLPAREASVSRPTASAEFGLLTAGLSVCTPRLLQGASLRAGLCLGGELGDMWGRARGFSVSRSGNALWRAGRFDVEARWALAPGVGLDLVLSALAPLERYRFVIEEFNPGFADPWYSALTLHRAQPVAARASLGLSVELGGRD